jgi:D-lactate dehydrogenase
MTNAFKYKQLARQFKLTLDKKRVITDPALCYALGTDASFYRLQPQIIVKVSSKTEIRRVIELCNASKTPYTFRAAGTSLSGQAISDSVLIMLTDDWRKYEILESGDRIKLQPGIIGTTANQYLLPYQRKIGPDPASINSCKIGGIAANNASGMCCGTAHNSYQTVSEMTVVLTDGSLVDTGDINSVQRFKVSHSKLLEKLKQLATDTQNDQKLKQLIKHKYRLKNTTGYSLNALIDFDEPIEILKHLMIGSEGTLGFIADITYQTIPDYPHKASALVVYKNIEQACLVVTELNKSKQEIAAVELIDGKALASITDKKGVPDFIIDCNLESCALLIECHADSKEALLELIHKHNQVIQAKSPIAQIEFTSDKNQTIRLWNVRKGLFPAVGAVRAKGTSVVIEDIAFPVELLAEATRDLQRLFEIYSYDQAIIFGHALEGNLHFVFAQDFTNQPEVRRYQQFMQQVSQLVAIKYQGSLKAEHGTGRNMAPFVELEWGKKAYSLMKQIKALFDPENLMNPDVIISDDQEIHLKNLKSLPIANDLIDACIECGFCESVCPSRNLSLTPRQRIVMYRQIQQLSSQKQTAEIKNKIKEITKQFDYLGIDTCAATGLCAEECPVDINTGELIKNLRGLSKGSNWRLNNLGATSSALKSSFKANQLIQKLIPNNVTNLIGSSLHSLSSSIPIWFSEYPTANNSKIKPTKKCNRKVVYYPSCGARAMGTQPNAKDQRSLEDVTISLLEKAGCQVIIPSNISKSCCGLPFESNGLNDIAQQEVEQLEAILWQASDSGKHPILIDTSPCKKRAIDNFNKQLTVYEPTEFTLRFLVDNLEIRPINESIMLHITCSSSRMNLNDSMTNVAKICAKNVIIPQDIHCCGFAGDKGFLLPELNESALSTLKQQIPENCTRGYSNSITCEIGLSKHGGIPYQSILYLLDEVSISKRNLI